MRTGLDKPKSAKAPKQSGKKPASSPGMTPNVSTEHPLFHKASDGWKIVRDVVAGSRAVKAQAERYLPLNHKQDPEDYIAMQKRALFLGATKRALKAFTGFVFRKNPDFTMPDALTPFMNDATLTGKSFYDYCKEVVREVQSVGRTGTLIEWDSPADENRAFLMRYETEDIINWKHARIGGQSVLSLLVLHDMSTIPSAAAGNQVVNAEDPFAHQQWDEWKVYELLFDDQNRPYVYVSIWRREEASGSNKQSTKFIKIDEFWPNRKTFPLQRIPFVCHNMDGDHMHPEEIPLEDMAEVNISHYRTSADLETARHMCGQPTPYAIGFGDEEEYYLGSSEAWIADNPQAKAGFLEMSGSGLKALETAITEKERQMAALGARMLEQQSSARQPEAYETVQIRQSGETSALTDITIACMQTLSKVMQWAVWWSGTGGDDTIEDHADEAFVELNTDFVSSRLDSAQLATLTQSYLQGAISYETYFFNLQEGEIIPSEKTIEEEKAAIESSPVRTPAPPGAPPAAGPQPTDKNAGGDGLM